MKVLLSLLALFASTRAMAQVPENVNETLRRSASDRRAGSKAAPPAPPWRNRQACRMRSTSCATRPRRARGVSTSRRANWCLPTKLHAPCAISRQRCSSTPFTSSHPLVNKTLSIASTIR